MTGAGYKWCSGDKEVVVAVYEERSRLLPEGKGLRRHHHHYNYNRRAELLDYSRHLRASSPPRHIKQPQISSSGDRKRKHPTCFHKWECIIPSFLRSATAFNTIKEKGKKSRKKKTVSTKMNALVKSLQLQKKGNFLSQLFTTLKKRR